MFCSKSTFTCRLCSGKTATSVWEPQKVQFDRDSPSVCLKTESSIPILHVDQDVASPCENTCPLPSPLTHSEERSSPTGASLNPIFCTRQVESAPHCGDTNYLDVQNLAVRDLPDPKESVLKDDTPHGFFSLAALKIHLDPPLLVSITDEVFHGLASLRQVGDYSEPPRPPKQPSPQDDVDESVTIPDFSSSNTHDEPYPGRTSTRWTQISRVRNKYNWKLTDHHSCNRRPQAPIRFSRRTNSEPSTARCVSFDSLALELNVGHTSTTHEVRWTQVEQETVNTTGTMDANLLVPFGSRLSGRYSTDGFHRNPGITNSASATSLLPSTHLEDKRYKSLPSLTTDHPYQEPSSCAGDGISGYENSMLPVPGNESRSTRSLNDLTLVRETVNSRFYVTLRSGRYCSPCSYSTVQNELTIMHRSSIKSIPVFPRSLPSSPFLDLPSLPFAEYTQYTLRDRCVHVDEETTRMDTFSSIVFDSYPTSMQRHDSVSISCILSGPPVASEPPSIHIRPKQPKLTPSTLHLAEEEEDETFTVHSSNVSRSFVMRHHRMPARMKQDPVVVPVTNIVLLKEPEIPYNTCLPCGSLSKIRKMSELDRLNLNRLGGEVKLEPAGELCSHVGEPFQCVYVEVSLCRNLNGVAPPPNLTTAEAYYVHTLLTNRLQNAVATRFLSEPVVSVAAPRHSNSSDHSAPVEDGDAPPEDSKDHLFPLGKVKVRSNSYLNTLISRVGNSCHRKYRFKQTNKGIYAFTPGPGLATPPKQWGDHFKTVGTLEGRVVCAWKIDDLDTHVGGLINFGHHLHVIASSEDGRLGLVYQQAESLLSEMTRKGTTYVNNTVLGESISGPEDIIRLFVHSPILYRLVARNLDNMSPSIGVEDPNICVAAFPQTSRSDIVLVQAKKLDSMSAVDQVNHLLTCINRLEMLHQELYRNAHTLRHYVMPVETAEYLFNRMQTHHSLARDVVTQKIVKGLKDDFTFYGGTLSHCIRLNAYCPWELYPRACDPDAYGVFNRVFDVILSQFSRVNEASSQPETCYLLPRDQILKTSVTKALSFQVRFSRNLDRFGFPPVMSEQDFRTVEGLCKAALLSWKEEGTGSFYSLVDLEHRNPKLFASLQRKQLLIPKQTTTRKVFGTYRFWPYGRAIYVAPETVRNCDLVVQVNADDHLRLICVDWTGKRPHVAYNRVVRLLTWLDTRLRFSKSPRWGYLSPAPLNVGTGMKFSCCFKVANGNKNPTSAVERVCAQYKLRVVSVRQPGSATAPYVFEVVPISTVGRTEAGVAIHFLNSLQEMSQNFGKYLIT